MTEMDKKFPITSITIGLDVRDMQYGAGTGRFIHLKADAPSETEGLTTEEAFDRSIEMFLGGWKSVIAARYATGVGKALEADKQIRLSEKKIERLKSMLAQEEQVGE